MTKERVLLKAKEQFGGMIEKSLDNTAFFFLCVLVAKVETVILS